MGVPFFIISEVKEYRDFGKVVDGAWKATNNKKGVDPMSAPFFCLCMEISTGLRFSCQVGAPTGGPEEG